MLRQCVSHHKLPLLFLIFMAWQAAEGIASFTRHRSRQHSSCVNANLSVLYPGYTRDHTAGELQTPHAHRARPKAYSRRPVHFTPKGLFIRKIANLQCPLLGPHRPILHPRRCFPHQYTTSYSKIPSPEWEELSDLPWTYHTPTCERRESGEHSRCSNTQFHVVGGDGGRPRL